MRTGRVVPSLILFLVLASPLAFAQSPSPKLELFLEGGDSYSNTGSGTETVTPIAPCPFPGCSPITVHINSSYTERVHPVGGARYRFTRMNALEASYSYSPYRLTAQPAGQALLAGYNRADSVSFNYVRYLSAKARVQPYLTIGLGTNRFSGPSNAPAVANGYTRADNGWHSAWNYGGGADVAFARRFALRLELRDYLTGQPKGIPGNSHNLVPSAGVVFRFK